MGLCAAIPGGRDPAVSVPLNKKKELGLPPASSPAPAPKPALRPALSQHVLPRKRKFMPNLAPASQPARSGNQEAKAPSPTSTASSPSLGHGPLWKRSRGIPLSLAPQIRSPSAPRPTPQANFSSEALLSKPTAQQPLHYHLSPLDALPPKLQPQHASHSARERTLQPHTSETFGYAASAGPATTQRLPRLQGLAPQDSQGHEGTESPILNSQREAAKAPQGATGHKWTPNSQASSSTTAASPESVASPKTSVPTDVMRSNLIPNVAGIVSSVHQQNQTDSPPGTVAHQAPSLSPILNQSGWDLPTNLSAAAPSTLLGEVFTLPRSTPPPLLPSLNNQSSALPTPSAPRTSSGLPLCPWTHGLAYSRLPGVWAVVYITLIGRSIMKIMH